MTFNHSDIMSTAHSAARECVASPFYAGRSYARVFAGQLRHAWADAKCIARQARKAAEFAAMSEADRLRAAIQDLENRDTLGHEGIERLAALRQAYYAAADLEAKREAIAAAKGRFASVTFTKKDGSVRVMRVQPAALKKHVVGDAASEAAKQAVETRTARHPHLMPVWDMEAQGIRSVNLTTVSRIAVDGVVREYTR